MTERTYNKMLARLTANAAMTEACVKADPLPFIKRAQHQMLELHKVLVAVDDALNDTNWVFDDAAAMNVPCDFYKADTARVRKARDTLAKWMSGQS